MGRDLGQGLGADPAHAPERARVRKCTATRALAHDLLRQLGADPGQELELRGRGLVGIEAAPVAKGIPLRARNGEGWATLRGAARRCGLDGARGELLLAQARQRDDAGQREQAQKREATV